jgi:uncharacterized protein YdhG (YjbR/CyaY superfamily)
MSSKPKTIEEYIFQAPEQTHAHLLSIYHILKKIAPDATEAIKWSQPVFEQKRILFSFSAFKSHINFMPTGQTLSHFSDEIKDYKTGKDTIQFSYAKPLPVDLIEKLAKHRLLDVLDNDAKWMY